MCYAASERKVLYTRTLKQVNEPEVSLRMWPAREQGTAGERHSMNKGMKSRNSLANHKHSKVTKAEMEGGINTSRRYREPIEVPDVEKAVQ